MEKDGQKAQMSMKHQAGSGSKVKRQNMDPMHYMKQAVSLFFHLPLTFAKSYAKTFN